MYRILNYTRIKPRSRPPQKKSAYFTHPDFSATKMGKKVCKLHKQIQYNHLTSLLTPGSRVLLEKLTSSQLVKKFPAFYGTQKFITVFSNACHPSLS